MKQSFLLLGAGYWYTYYYNKEFKNKSKSYYFKRVILIMHKITFIVNAGIQSLEIETKT